MNLPAAPTAPAVKQTCQAYCPGMVEYGRACRLQERLLEARYQGDISHDIVLILQHPPVLTVGKAGYRPEHVLVTGDKLEQEGIPICQSSRGGGISYHGPGQLLCYPIFNLRSLGLTVKEYIHKLEDVVIETLARFDIEAGRMPPMPGLWVNGAEISSVGIYVSHGITMHGFTLNVNTDLNRFTYINVCGLAGKKVTSVEQICGSKLPIEDFITPIIESFDRVFQLDIHLGDSIPADICEHEYDE